MAVFVIDDILCAAKPVLKELWWQPWAAGTTLSQEDVLIVNASALTGASKRRSACEGLATLNGVLADPDQNLGGVAVISFEPLESLLSDARKPACDNARLLRPPDFIPFQQLPLGLEELKALPARARGVSREEWKWCLLRLEASNRLLRVENACYRHDHKNLIAAVRIYLGALQAGQAGLGKAPEVLAKLAQLEAQSGDVGTRSIQPSRIVTACRKHRALVKQVSQVAEGQLDALGPQWASRKRLFNAHIDAQGMGRLTRGNYKVLMLDDEYDTRGWKLVIDAIAGNPKNVTYAADWQRAKEELSNPDNHFDVMLLDCNLGEGKATGLELLSSLRSFSRDLPIVMMTAYDDAELALWSLRAGCNDFYAKELRDNTNRDSLDYFLRFVRSVRRQEWERELREQWGAFQSLLSGKVSGVHAAEPHLRCAFYFMFSLSDESTWWVPGSPQATRERENDDVSETSRVAVLSVNAAISACRMREDEFSGRTQGILQRARHISAKPVLAKEAVGVLTELIGKLQASRASTYQRVAKVLTKGPTMPTGCPYARSDLASDDERRQPGLTKARPAHPERSGLGAIQFMLGCVTPEQMIETSFFDRTLSMADAKPREAVQAVVTQYTISPRLAAVSAPVAFVDDSGEAEGWKDALEAVFGSQLQWLPSVDDLLARRGGVQGFSAILLDLCLIDPLNGRTSPTAGLDALKRIKNVDPGIPVLILSAADDALNALRCLRQGALDYLPKWLPTNVHQEQCKEFAQCIVTRLQAAAKLGTSNLRRIWQDFRNLQAGFSLLSSCPALFDGVNGFQYLTEYAVRAQFCNTILPALLIYQGARLAELMDGRIPPVDDWRVKGILATRASATDDTILAAGRAVEYLGWMRCCVDAGRRVASDKWQKAHWIAKIGRNAGAVWRARNWILHPGRRSGTGRPNPTTVLQGALRALPEFEQGLLQDAPRILCNRTV